MVGFAQPNLLAFLLHLYFMKFWPDIQWCGYSKISAVFPLAKKTTHGTFFWGVSELNFRRKSAFAQGTDASPSKMFCKVRSSPRRNLASKQTNKNGLPMCACAFVLMIGGRSRLQTLHLNWATFKTLMTFHYADWFIGILIMTSYDPHIIG